MRNLFLFLFLVSAHIMVAQDILGQWKTIDDETGEAKSIVEIYEKQGKVYGKIVQILNPDRQNALCTKCEGKDKDRPINGLEIIKGLKQDGEAYKGGTIFDPEKGKEYKCRLALAEDPDVLQVRGYIAFLYKNQYWERVK